MARVNEGSPPTRLSTSGMNHIPVPAFTPQPGQAAQRHLITLAGTHFSSR